MTEADPSPPDPVPPVGSPASLTETFHRGQVTDLRHRVAQSAESFGLTDQRLDDFVLAVNELITNAVRHGGGRGWLRLWPAGQAVICEVSDSGAGIRPDRLAQRDRPTPNTAGGWGLWLTEQLSDTMTVATGPAGTTVRITVKVAAARNVAAGPAASE